MANAWTTAARHDDRQHDGRPTYRLRRGSKKELCPNCQAKRFVPYVDEKGNEPPHDGKPFGRCDRENSCAYHRKPWEHGGHDWQGMRVVQPPRIVRRQKRFMDGGLVEAHDKPNVLTNWIHDRFGADTLARLKKSFDVGTLDMHGRTFTVFWLTDEAGNIHTGKAVPYELRAGAPRRIKTGFGGAYWMHKTMNPPPRDEEWTTQPFGLRQLRQMPHAPVGVVESEKTALLCAAALPDIAWVAVGGLQNLTAYNNECTVLAALKGRRVVLYPDADGVDDWTTKAGTLKKNGFNVVVDTDWIRGITDDQRAAGYDLGDLIAGAMKPKMKPR